MVQPRNTSWNNKLNTDDLHIQASNEKYIKNIVIDKSKELKLSFQGGDLYWAFR
jgi:hypothetical protein